MQIVNQRTNLIKLQILLQQKNLNDSLPKTLKSSLVYSYIGPQHLYRAYCLYLYLYHFGFALANPQNN